MGVRLPAEYQEVEYLESTGTQYIDTGTYYLADDSITIKCSNTSGSDRSFFGVYGSGTEIAELNVYGDKFRYDVLATGEDTIVAYIAYTVQKSGNKWYLNDRLVANGINKDVPQHSILMFARWYNGPTKNVIGRIYSYQHSRSGGLVRFYTPCYRKSDNKPGMYDLVSETFYTNQGTGEFLVGPDVVDHISPRLMDRRRVLIAKLTSLFKNIISSETGLVSFNTNFAKPMKVTCEFSPKQEGTGDPSPENIRPISAWDGANIFSRGKNLFGGNALASAFHDSFNLTLNDGELGPYVRWTGLVNGKLYFKDYFKVKENTRYTLIFGIQCDNVDSWIFSVNYTDGSKDSISSVSANEFSQVVFISKENKTISFIDLQQRDVYKNLYFNYSGVFEGVITVDDFEPYQSSNLSIPFNNPGTYDFLPIQAGTGDPSPENVRLITPGLTFTRDDTSTLSVYSGTLTVNEDGSGTLVADVIGKRVTSDLGTINFSVDRVRYTVMDMFPVDAVTTISNQQYLCNIFPKVYGSTAPGIIFTQNGDGTIPFILFRGLDSFGITNTLEGWNQFITDNEVFITYVLSTPTTYTLSVAETSRAFEALGLGKNLGPLYGGTVTINKDGSVDVVSDMAIKNASFLDSLSDITVDGDLIKFTGTISPYVPSDSRDQTICNILAYGSIAAWEFALTYILSNKARMYIIRLPKTTEIEAITTISALRSYLNNLGIQFVYFLSELQIYHFSSIADFKSFLGTNNIWSDLNGPITVEYYNNKKE